MRPTCVLKLPARPDAGVDHACRGAVLNELHGRDEVCVIANENRVVEQVVHGGLNKVRDESCIYTLFNSARHTAMTMWTGLGTAFAVLNDDAKTREAIHHVVQELVQACIWRAMRVGRCVDMTPVVDATPISDCRDEHIGQYPPIQPRATVSPPFVEGIPREL